MSLPRFFYRCSEGHELVSPKPLDRCLGFHLGIPCRGTLAQYGPGSRKAA